MKFDVSSQIRNTLRDREWHSLAEIVQSCAIPPERASHRYLESQDTKKRVVNKEELKAERLAEPPEVRVAKGRRIIVSSSLHNMRSNAEIIEESRYDHNALREEWYYKMVRCYCYSCGDPVSSDDGELKAMLCIKCDGVCNAARES